jgi:hypothetical protein
MRLKGTVMDRLILSYGTINRRRFVLRLVCIGYFRVGVIIFCDVRYAKQIQSRKKDPTTPTATTVQHTMGLFSTLLNASNASEAVSSEGTGAGSTSGSSKAPSDLPTVIQLFSKYPIPIAVVDTAALATEILEATGGKKHNQNQQQQKRKTLVNSRHSLFAPLHYFAVQCKDPNQFSDLDSSQSAFMSGGLRKNALALKNMDTKLLTPDLGIWNCRAEGLRRLAPLLPRR